MRSRYKFLLVLVIGIVYASLQFPFVSADPDLNIAENRDANTDEGLNTCQIRNYVNHKDLTLTKSDNFIKAPLFGGLLFIPFKLFGTSQMVGRVTVLLLSLAICLYIFGYNRYYAWYGMISLVVVLCEYYIFHNFHFCLAEIFSTTLIFLSVFVAIESGNRKIPIRSGFLSATFMSFAFYLKIQFLYTLLILPLSVIIIVLLQGTDKKQWIKQLLYTMLFLAMYSAMYFVIWYLPNRGFYDYVMANQLSDRFVSLSNLPDHLNFILKHIFYNGFLRFYTLSFLVLFISGLIYTFITESDRFRYLFIGLTCWTLIELHKLTMTYLPTRYLVSLFFPMGLIIALVLLEFMKMKGKNKLSWLIKALSVLLFLSFGIKNGRDYISALKNRKFTISSVNHYLAAYKFQDRPIVGAWAPSLSWESRAITFPVWKDYFNDGDVIKKYNPAIIIAETDEEDSNQAFSSQGVDLDLLADSIKYFTINRWSLKLLWIGELPHIRK
jgi:hypothetical protein